MVDQENALEELGIEPGKAPEPPQDEPKQDIQAEPEPGKKPDGYERVDFNKLPDDVREEFEARFNRLYGGRKRDQAAMRQMAQDMRGLFDEVKQLRKGQNDRERESEIAGLQARQAAALEQGDYQEASRLNTYMAKLYTQAAQPEPKPSSPSQNDLPALEKALITDWGDETDSKGQLVRPWTRQGHPEYEKALKISMEVWERDDLTPYQKVNEIDRKMKPASRPTQPQMLSSDPNFRPDEKKEKLTPEQRQIAANMFPEMKPEDAIKEYRKGVSPFDGGLA